MPNELGINKEETFVCCGTSHEEDYKMALEHRYLESGYLLTNYTNLDASMNSDNRGVLTMTYIDQYEAWNLDQVNYKQKKIQVISLMKERLYRDYPALEGHIVVCELATPKTMERYTKNSNGSVYGYRQDVKQAGYKKIICNIGLKGISLVGAWITPGGGYEGTITGAIIESHKIHEKLKSMKFN